MRRLQKHREPISLPNTYPLPNAIDLFARLAKGQWFSKLDLHQAYNQLVVDDESADLLTLNTSKGLFRVLRLPFDISTASGIFQRFMETLLAGLDGICIFLDDVLVAGEMLEGHDLRLQVLMRIQESGLRLKASRCELYQQEIEFLGFKVNADGVHPILDKAVALYQTPRPSTSAR